MIIGLLGFAGLAVDVGYLQWQRRMLQAAADSAAMGALRQLELGTGSTAITTAGQYSAQLNGFTDGQNSATVSILNPPTAGSYSGDTSAVQATVSKNYPTFFMMIFGQNNVSISAKAVARTTTSSGTIGGCIFALNPTASASLEINGTSLSLHTACSMIDESTDYSAFKMDSGAILYMGGHAHVGVVGPGGTGSTIGNGGWSLSGQQQILDITYSPNAAETPVNITNPGDPLQNVVAPTPSNGMVTGGIQSSSSMNISKNHMPTNNQLSPGIYCGGFTIGDTGGNTLQFQPGIYVIAGGGATFNSSANVAGSSVMFYNTSSTGWGCSGSSGAAPVKFNGQATAVFSAPTTGNGVGILFFQDRSLDAGNSIITGGAGSTFDGGLYFKKSKLSFTGSNATSGYLVLVADTIAINGTGTIGNNYTSLSDPNPYAPVSTGSGLVQ
ncbi:MAG TPA: TadG family pilus assembly protein [Bryobacteraceae bacterium]|jgi:hypothetical protein